MIEFIGMMDIELSMIEEVIDPPDEIRPGEETIGEISHDLQKLYTLWKQRGKSAGVLENEIRWGEAGSDTQTKVEELKAKSQVLNVIFWIAVQDELKIWGLRQGLALRKGFKIVTTPPQEVMPFFKFFPGGPDG